MAILEKIRGWAAEQIGIYSIIILAVLSTALAGVGIAMSVADAKASYLGWGKIIVDTIDSPAGGWLGWVIAVVPSLLQMAYFSAATVDFEPLTEHKLFNLAAKIALVADNILDIVSMTRWVATGATVFVSIFCASVTAILFFTLASELFISLFVPVSFTLWGVVFGRVFSRENLAFSAKDFGPRR